MKKSALVTMTKMSLKKCDKLVYDHSGSFDPDTLRQEIKVQFKNLTPEERAMFETILEQIQANNTAKSEKLGKKNPQLAAKYDREFRNGTLLNAIYHEQICDELIHSIIEGDYQHIADVVGKMKPENIKVLQDRLYIKNYKLNNSELKTEDRLALRSAIKYAEKVTENFVPIKK